MLLRILAIQFVYRWKLVFCTFISKFAIIHSFVLTLQQIEKKIFKGQGNGQHELIVGFESAVGAFLFY